MVSSDSLQPTVTAIADRYSSLFTLPSQKEILAWLLALSILGGSLTSISAELSSANLITGLIMGFSIFLLTLLGDHVNSRVFMRSDPILDLRRCSFLSASSCVVLYAFAFSANLSSLADRNMWIKIMSAGFFAAFTLRLFVFSMVSSLSYHKKVLPALSQPTFFLAVSIFSRTGKSDIGFGSLILPITVPAFLAIIGIYIFSLSVDAAGKRSIGVSSLSLFRAFLANWTEGLNEPLEHFFERLGEERSIKVSLLAFKGKNNLKAVMIVPAIHPGPFRNTGSSLLPSLIQTTLKSKLNCLVSVPHGISGHDLDLASHIQNERVLREIAKSAEFESFGSRATELVRSEVEGASATCQIFGDCALFSLTLAPETMEDLPRELDYEIFEEVKRSGLATAIVIDAHNSIQGPFDREKAVKSLRRASTNAFEKALKYQPQPLQVGTAEIIPDEFAVRDGIGPGGISVIVAKAGDRKAAYVTIDGNNMISGLRERILSRLKGLTVGEAEVFTTDTHIVTGTVKVNRGYHPVGEAIDQDRLVNYIEQTASDALENLEPAEFSWREVSTPDVKVIGERQIANLSLLTERTVERVKKTSILIFPTMAILLAIYLTVL